MDESEGFRQALSYTERDAIALLDSEGRRLYLYFCLMLGDDVAATRALGDTVIAARPGASRRELFTIARTVCRQYQSVPAAPDARARVPDLTALTLAALLRLDPDDREICVLGAPRYQLSEADLAAVLGTRVAASLRREASARFGWELEACAADAGLEERELPARALRIFGSEPVALPYDQIVPLATDPALEGLREGIRARVALPTEAAPAAERPLGGLGTGRRAAATTTVPLHQAPGGADRRRAVVGTVLVAGVIPAAIAGVALAGHSDHQGRSSAASPPSAVPGASARPGVSSPAGARLAPRAGRSPAHSAPVRTAGAVPSAAQLAAGVSGATPAVASLPAAPSATTAPPPVTSSPPPTPTTPAASPSPSPTATNHHKHPKPSPPGR